METYDLPFLIKSLDHVMWYPAFRSSQMMVVESLYNASKQTVQCCTEAEKPLSDPLRNQHIPKRQRF